MKSGKIYVRNSLGELKEFASTTNKGEYEAAWNEADKQFILRKINYGNSN